jgi:LysR family hydrogen peroxide-inducible transcriptional activator
MSKPTFQQLAYLVALADEGHFGRAADACNVSQPALSNQIQELERRLGATLVERLAKGARLTTEGEQIVGRARRVLADLDELVDSAQHARDSLFGVLAVGAIPTVAPYVLGDFVPEVVGRHPSATLRFEELQTHDLLAALRNGQIDLGLCALPVDGNDLVAQPLLDDRFVLALATTHPLASCDTTLDTSVLASENVLLLAEGHCLRDQALAICSNVQAQPTDLRATSLHTLVQMVAANVGVTLLPATATGVEARPGNGVVVREFIDPPSRTLALVWRASSPHAPHYQELATQFSLRLRAKMSASQ